MRGEPWAQRSHNVVNHLRLGYLQNKAAAQRFFGRDRIAKQQEALRKCWTKGGDKPRSVRHRKAVSQRACDWYAEAGRWRRDPKIAGRCDQKTASHCHALHYRNCRYRQLFDRCDNLVDTLLVGDPVLNRGKGQKLADVRASGERFANAPKNGYAHFRVTGDGTAGSS